MIIGARIRDRLEALGRSQGWLAREIELSPQAISKLIRGETNETGKLYQIARALQSTPEFLSGESDEPALPHLAEPPSGFRAQGDFGLPDVGDLIGVREIDLRFGMGATELEIPVTSKMRYFNRDWLRQYTTAPPEALYFAQGIGDSQMPTIWDSDTLLIDTSDQTIRVADKFWAVAFGNSGMIRRLRSMPDGSVKLLCDNKLVPGDVAYDGEMHILGRVVAIVRKM